MAGEDEYSPRGEEDTRRDAFFVLSGCSGSGKSSLLAELSRRGYATVEEPGRQIVVEQLGVGGNALPWENSDRFLELLLLRYIDVFNRMRSHDGVVFFDRSIVELVSHFERIAVEVPEHISRAARTYRYAKKVFMTPPWQEIYRTDEERRHSFEDAVAEYTQLLPSYAGLGYEIALAPKASVAERAEFVLRGISRERPGTR